MSKELYGEVISHLLTSIALECDVTEKARLTELCKKVIVASGMGK